ncbi:MAG: hypothetical protein PHQ74_01340 [Crocinitomicaceae bacterium]|nr:hypothetical protein [Crocinitomicaceae bacterium]
MKIFILFFTFSFVLSAGMFLVGCKKEQPQMSELNKGCDCAKEVSAEFLMEEMAEFPGASSNKFTSTDTIFKNKNVQFRAMEEDAEYTWYIGQEVLTTQEVIRYFNASLAGQNIPISLVVKKKPNNICLPLDDGYDSITKTLTVTQYINDTGTDFEFGSIEASYRVKSEHLPDSFDIKIYLTKESVVNSYLHIENYDGYGTICDNHNNVWKANYRQIYFLNAGVCDLINGDFHNRMDGVFEMNINFYYQGHPEYKVRKYLGRRL